MPIKCLINLPSSVAEPFSPWGLCRKIISSGCLSRIFAGLSGKGKSEKVDDDEVEVIKDESKLINFH